MILLDTSAAILLRDADPRALALLDQFPETNAVSILTVVELLCGLIKSGNPHRRELLDAFLSGVEILPFEGAQAETYGHILEQAGFSRRKLLDRLIAATALTHSLPLATLNPQDFADVPGLEVLNWGDGA